VKSLLRTLALAGTLAWLASPAVAAEIQPSEIQDAAASEAHSAAPATIDGQPGVDTSPLIAVASHEEVAAIPASEGGSEHAAAHEEHSAGHGEHASFSGKTFALQLLNFGVLLFLLIYFGGRAMNKSLRARHDQLKGDISEAARLRDEAMEKFKTQEQRVSNLEDEIAALRASMQKDAESEQARLLEGAQERTKRIQDEMRFQMDQQVKEAELLLRAEVASASVKLAEGLVRKAVNMDDERRLAQEFVAAFDGSVGPEGTVR
jgi:F-type H+-transporting ATPase subunit b